MSIKRRRQRSYPVYAATGYRVIDRTSEEQAQEFEARGIWRREYDTVTGQLLGFRLDGADTNKVDADLPHSFTSVAISRTEMEINAGGMRASHTFRLTEPDRMARIKNGMPPEDRVERVIEKIRVYPFTHSKSYPVVVIKDIPATQDWNSVIGDVGLAAR